MALIPLKCPVCAGEISIDDGSDTGICQYCGLKIMVTEKIKQRLEIDNSNAAENWRTLAVAAIDAGKYDQAAVHAEKILSTNHLNAEAWFLMGKAAYAMRDYKGADTYWTESMDATPDDQKANRILDVMNAITGDKPTTAESREKALQYVDLGLRYSRIALEHWPQAEEPISEAIKDMEQMRNELANPAPRNEYVYQGSHSTGSNGKNVTYSNEPQKKKGWLSRRK